MESLSPDSLVAVLPRKEWSGLNRLSEAETAQPVPVVPIVEAFEREWADDAHFTLYLNALHDPREPFYRINKPCLPDIRAEGDDVHVKLIALEWDTGKGPTHVPWTTELWNAFQERLAAIAAAGLAFAARVAQAAWSYSTRRGWRWVWRLTKGVPADDAEPLIRGLAAEAKAAGLDMDDSGSVLNWAQPFRLPKVLRDGVRTSQDPFFALEAHPERRLDPASISPVGKPDYEHSASSRASVPVDEEAYQHITTRGANNQLVYTDFAKWAKKELGGQVYAPYLFSPKVFDSSDEGKRHDLIRTWTLSAAGHIVRKFPSATVEHLYALFLPLTLSIDDEKDGKKPNDRRRDTWRLCLGAWEMVLKEVRAERAAQIAEKQQEIKLELTGAERIVAGVRSWFPDLPEDPTEAWDWIQARMILRRGKSYFVMRRDGFYSSRSEDGEGLIPRIKQLGMDEFIPLEVETKQGTRPVKRDELLLRYVTAIDRVETRVNAAGAHLLNPEREEGLTLVIVPFRRRRDLKPEFHPGVDLWLRTLATAQDPARWEKTFKMPMDEFFLIHLASFLDFEGGPTAAISLALAPGAGKKLLAHGLLECMEDPDHATGEDLVQRFNSKLTNAPFLFVNEGLPEGRGMYHPTDTLRRIITGDYFQTERKFGDAINSKSSIRCLLTANGFRLIDAFGEGRDLSPHEADALGIRLVHYPTTDAAAELLRSKGGNEWTKGWIEGDAGEPSQFIVAKHLLWLYENMRPKLKGRLLVEGSAEQEAIQRLRIQGGSTPTVIEAIFKILQNPMLKTDGSQGVLIEGSRLSVTISAIFDAWREKLTRGSSDRLTLKRIAMSLKGLLVGEPGKLRSIHGRKDRWNEIDVRLLHEEGEKYGLSAPKLDELLKLRLAEILPPPGTNGTNGTNGANGTSTNGTNGAHANGAGLHTRTAESTEPGGPVILGLPPPPALPAPGGAS